ncbi:MAG: YkgJ family cysteine cluster protein [Psychroflexus sp.]|jgi:Fe-S-cluster containining protein|nr:YkgJ family cysteine cluster protein [Psychroflexus sp.]MDR9447960.1 YkgJ family cysteine cluster protein [Psychroflexus sp.]
MVINPKNIAAKAAAHKKEHQTFFKKLKKKPPKDLDQTMQQLHDEVFEETDCLDCANCCKTTSPIFTPKDVSRIAKRLKMSSRQFFDTYLITDDDGDMVLPTSPCPFLFSDHKCMIYDVRPKACAEYPHTDRKKFHQITNLTLNNLSICPAAFKIVEKLQDKIKAENL